MKIREIAGGFDEPTLQDMSEDMIDAVAGGSWWSVSKGIGTGYGIRRGLHIRWL